jgi:hypothetical protein
VQDIPGLLFVEATMIRNVFADDESVYLIWSLEHGAWWRPNSGGYTTQISEAGWYLIDEAKSILYGANIAEVHECAIPIRMLVRMGVR